LEGIVKMKKEKVLYICGGKYFESNILDWYETFKSACKKSENINMDKNKIETPYAIIEFVRRKPLFTKKYDLVLKADVQNDNAILFAVGIGKKY